MYILNSLYVRAELVEKADLVFFQKYVPPEVVHRKESTPHHLDKIDDADEPKNGLWGKL